MLINGKNRGFMLTVGSSLEIARLCPDEDLTRIGEILGGSYTDNVNITIKIICAMNKGYEDFKAFTEEGYTPDYLTQNALFALPNDVFKELSIEALKAFKGDSKTIVELEGSKK